MQIHLAVNNGGRQCARVHARVSECTSVWVQVRVCVRLFLENTGTSLSQCSDAVSANVGRFGAG